MAMRPLLLETGQTLLLDTGEYLLLEDSDTEFGPTRLASVSIATAAMADDRTTSVAKMTDSEYAIATIATVQMVSGDG